MSTAAKGRISRAKLSLFAVALLGASVISGEASATLIDGVNVDVGNGGQVIFDQFDRDTLLTGVGSTLRGVGLVSQIHNTLSGVSYLAPCAPVKCAGTFIADVFDGLTVRAVVPNAANTGNDVYLTGGSINYYILNKRPNQNAGTIAKDITNSTSSTLWLSLKPEVFDAEGDTFHIFVPGNNLATFNGNAQGDAFLDVVGGDAASIFDTNGFKNDFSGALADFQFIGNATRLQRGGNPNLCPRNVDFCVQGTNNLINMQHVPEPGSLLLLATGLLSFAGAAFGRKRLRQPA